MFAKAMSAVYTWNGAISNMTPDISGSVEGRLSLFFKSIRGISDDKLYEYLETSTKENIVDTYILAFQVRDCRGGKGERDIGRKMLKWLFLNTDSKYFEKVFHLIPEYGRWDDLLLFFPNFLDNFITEYQKNLQEKIIKYICNKLFEDQKLMNNGKPVSLVAKWCPTEGDSDDKKHKLVKTICSNMNITPKEYRTKYITPLRSYLRVVESLMCRNKWDEINFNNVPSCAMLKLKKTFEKHVPAEFQIWKEGLKTGASKVNAKQLFPHEIIKEIRQKNGEVDEICEEQWNVLEKEVEKLGSLEDTLVVVDNSASMMSPNFLPIDTAYALGLLVSNIVKGEFHGNVITFNDNPTFFVIKDGDLSSRFAQMSSIPVGYTTDIQKTFEVILERCKKINLQQEKMPKRILIISDMQFNCCDIKNNSNTNFQNIEEKYKSSGYDRPDIIFWNVNGTTSDFPVTTDDNGTCLISGMSPSIIKSIINTDKIDSEQIMMETINDNRYKQIRELLKQI